MSLLKKFLLLPSLFCFIAQIAIGQTTIRGSVQDSNSGKPLPGVNVYLAGTTFGASTDKNGDYQFTIPSGGRYKLVFSFVGYKKKVFSVEFADSSSITHDVSLQQKVQKLGKIEVKDSNKKWQQQLDIFTSQFLGPTRFAQKVTIENPWVLNFKERDNYLIATAKEPLKIINNALGYRIHAELVKFQWPKYSDRGGTYKIYPRYTKLTAKSKKQRHQWKKNRLRNYLGSFTHFLKSLYHDKVYANNFNVKGSAFLSRLSPGKTRYKLLSVSGISERLRNNLKGFELTRKIMVQYDGSVTYQFDGSTHSLSVEKAGAAKANTDNHIFYVDENGSLLDPISVKLYMTWANERVANSLPTNYTAGD